MLQYGKTALDFAKDDEMKNTINKNRPDRRQLAFATLDILKMVFSFPSSVQGNFLWEGGKKPAGKEGGRERKRANEKRSRSESEMG